MATEVLEILTQNKNRAKRDLSSATFTMAMELPGGNTLADGIHTVGKIEGNVAITRVMLLVREGFDGTVPTIALTDSDSVDWFPATTIVVPGILESTVTANAATRPAPDFKLVETEFLATVVGGSSSKGELAFIVDYVQLDTVVGKHTV